MTTHPTPAEPVQILSLGAGVPTRPILRWHGGKWMLAPWIISQGENILEAPSPRTPSVSCFRRVFAAAVLSLCGFSRCFALTPSSLAPVNVLLRHGDYRLGEVAEAFGFGGGFIAFFGCAMTCWGWVRFRTALTWERAKWGLVCACIGFPLGSIGGMLFIRMLG